MNLHLSSDRCEIVIEQTRMIEDVVSEFLPLKLKNQPTNSPIQNKLQLKTVENGDHKDKFRRLLGKLMYIMICSRPDLCYSISFFSSLQKSANAEHDNYLLKVLQHPCSTKNLGLRFSKNDCTVLEGFADADFANDVNNSKSVSGLIFKVFGNVVLYASRKQ